MTTLTNQQARTQPLSKLPVRRSLKAAYLFSLLIMALTGIAAAASILAADIIYPTAELKKSFIANDVVTLFIGLPILLISMWLTHRGKLIGLLFWPGAIFYGLYNYTAYLIGTPLTIMYPLYLIIVTISIYTIIGLVASIDSESVKQRLTGHISEKSASGVLMVFGFVFGLRAIIMMVMNAASSQTPLAGPELGVLVADFIACTAWLIGGVLLWQRQPLGYVAGMGLLFCASMLFVGVIAILLLQPIISGGPLPVIDIVVLLVMGLICFVPFVLFGRGVVRS